jgi:pimeloyl-ACP methyl ester carboxylesterase
MAAVEDPMVPVPVPEQVPAKEGMAEVNGGKLWYWDTGGNGPAILFSHPASQSAAIWKYQQPFFAKAGYRVIAYSRRSYFKSDPVDPKNPGIASEDMLGLIDYLGVKKFHGVGCAGGGGVLADFVFSNPDRLISVTITSNPFAVKKGPIAEAQEHIRPHDVWDTLPRWFRELGPSYRGANPEGWKLWAELDHMSGGDTAPRQKTANSVTTDMLEKLKLPVLMMTGDADTSTPPSILRRAAAHIPGAQVLIIHECGHSPYWERPELFNNTILNFIKKHK